MASHPVAAAEERSACRHVARRSRAPWRVRPDPARASSDPGRHKVMATVTVMDMVMVMVTVMDTITVMVMVTPGAGEPGRAVRQGPGGSRPAGRPSSPPRKGPLGEGRAERRCRWDGDGMGTGCRRDGVRLNVKARTGHG